MVDFLQNEAWPFLRDYWLWVIIGLVAASILWKLAKFYFHFMAAKIATKRLVFLKVTLPRQEGEAERQEDTEKDFREKN